MSNERRSLVCLCLLKGIRSSGKVSYFTSAFPYLVLGSLAVRSLSLPGADMGLRQYITPKWERMLKVESQKILSSPFREEMVFFRLIFSSTSGLTPRPR